MQELSYQCLFPFLASTALQISIKRLCKPFAIIISPLIIKKQNQTKKTLRWALLFSISNKGIVISNHCAEFFSVDPSRPALYPFSILPDALGCWCLWSAPWAPMFSNLQLALAKGRQWQESRAWEKGKVEYLFFWHFLARSHRVPVSQCTRNSRNAPSCQGFYIPYWFSLAFLQLCKQSLSEPLFNQFSHLSPANTWLID